MSSGSGVLFLAASYNCGCYGRSILSWSLGTDLTRPKQTMRAFSLPSAKLTIADNGCNRTNSCNAFSWVKKPLTGAITGAISFTLLISSPSSLASVNSVSLQPQVTPPIEYCDEYELGMASEPAPGSVTNEGIVEEAWEIVNDSFLDTRSQWSPEKWLNKKKDVLSGSVRSRSKAHDIIQRMLSSLGDPYTRFLSPEQFSRMAKYDMTGIGINLREIPDKDGQPRLKVLGLLLGGPAHSAGVKQGDEVLSVNEENVRGKSAFEVSSLLQGPNETYVTVEVRHGNCGPIQSIKVQRQVSARTPVFYRLEEAENGAISVGYVRLKEFNALARKDLVTAMKRLQDAGASFFILDLRDNFGGLVQAGIEIAKLFLNEGNTIIYTVGRDPYSQNAVTADAPPSYTAPLLVLVNHNTASASEIVAAALHDNCRAVLAGDKTYGKGLIQSVFELHDGSGVAVTIGKYVTPNHLDINGNGLDPDFRGIPSWSEVTKQLSQCHRPKQG